MTLLKIFLKLTSKSYFLAISFIVLQTISSTKKVDFSAIERKFGVKKLLKKLQSKGIILMKRINNRRCFVYHTELNPAVHCNVIFLQWKKLEKVKKTQFISVLD